MAKFLWRFIRFDHIFREPNPVFLVTFTDNPLNAFTKFSEEISERRYMLDWAGRRPVKDPYLPNTYFVHSNRKSLMFHIVEGLPDEDIHTDI